MRSVLTTLFLLGTAVANAAVVWTEDFAADSIHVTKLVPVFGSGSPDVTANQWAAGHADVTVEDIGGGALVAHIYSVCAE